MISNREVTKSPLSQARAKLNPGAFRRHNEVAVNGFYGEASYYIWYGMRVLAMDGNRLMLPKFKTVVKEFGRLYHYRWNEEEAYKLLKSRMELEAFSGKTAIAIKQDFHAKVFMMSMCAVYAYPIEEKVLAEYKAEKDRKFQQKINRTNALATVMDMSIPMFLKRKFQESLDAFDELV